MWTAEQRQLYNDLREREWAGTLTDEERAGLAALMQQLNDREAAYLAPANERKAQEVAAMTTTVEQLESQNHRLREYLRERQAFLSRVKSLVADIRAEDRQMRERFADGLTLIGKSHSDKVRTADWWR
jgi:Rod binding domain-containing protein